MSTARILITIAAAAVITFTLRVLPFFAFGGERSMPGWLEKLGRILPSAIMAVLIVAVSYKLRHSTLLSIVLGTGAYMALLQIL